MNNNRQLVVLLPTYNEEKDIEKLVDTWMELTDIIDSRFSLELQVISINDGSRDRTEVIAKELESRYTNFHLHNHPQNMGLGAAVNTAFHLLMEEYPKAQYGCIMDCDNTQEPKYIIDMLEKQKQEGPFDVIIASRYQKGAKVQGLSTFRRMTSEGAKYVYKWMLPIPSVKD